MHGRLGQIRERFYLNVARHPSIPSHLHKRKRELSHFMLRKLIGFGAMAALALIAMSLLVVLSLRWIDPPTSSFMVQDRMENWFAASKEKYPLRHEWVDWPNIAWTAKVAVISSEDQRFAEHFGFDLKQINNALEERERGKRVRGASTISQQVAKNLFLWPGQSWIRKGCEAYFTLLIEAFWSKQRILEMYLNVAEFGRGTFGVGAASAVFFHKPTSRLSASDAALLAAVLPNPKRMRVDAPSRYVRSRQLWILNQMRRLGGPSVLTEFSEKKG
jgi:monofunctional glycosyltransferase